ncbi:MAG: hypothetical protein ABI921_03695 [Panacibacter sp.]
MLTKLQAGTNDSRFIDKNTAKRVHEHLKNANDHISEDDIKNVKTDFSETKENKNLLQPEPGEHSIEENDDTQNEEELKDNTDPGITTSWNILGGKN